MEILYVYRYSRGAIFSCEMFLYEIGGLAKLTKQKNFAFTNLKLGCGLGFTQLEQNQLRF